MLEPDVEEAVTYEFLCYLHYMLSLVGAVTIPGGSTPDITTVNKELMDLAADMVKAMNTNEARTNAIIEALRL